VPRATFEIALRGEVIRRLEHDENAPSFPTALSDGDRRTLAPAFFLARLDLDPDLGTKIVVLDDPMASFDRNRKEATVGVIEELATKCDQVIVLSHDGHFLKEIESKMRDRVHRTQVGYGNVDDASFLQCDLSGECTTSYMRHYALVSNYLAGPPQNNTRAVAGALRVLVEELYNSAIRIN
jgi:wobble nucleotide-excising tRNase